MRVGLMTSDILFIISVGLLIVAIAVLVWLELQNYVAEWTIVAVFALVFLAVSLLIVGSRCRVNEFRQELDERFRQRVEQQEQVESSEDCVGKEFER